MVRANRAMSSTLDTDIISLAALHLAATVGPDHWHRTRPQPLHLSLHLHLSPSSLNTPGQSDNVADSLHYGHLAKAVETRVSERRAEGYTSPRALLIDVTDAALTFVSAAGRDAAVHAVRVVVRLPKQILLAGGFEVELSTCASAGLGSTPGTIVRVTDLILPVLIGVNPPERLAKQRVITHLTFVEASSREAGPEGERVEMDYPAIVQQIVTASTSLYFFLSHLVSIETGRRKFDPSHARKTRL